MVRSGQIPTEIKHEGNRFDTSTHHRRLGRGLDRQCRVDGTLNRRGHLLEPFVREHSRLSSHWRRYLLLLIYLGFWDGLRRPPHTGGWFALSSPHAAPPQHNPLPSGAHHRPGADMVGAGVGAVERINGGD